MPQAYTTFIIMRGGKFVQLFFSARLFLHLFLVFHYLSRSMLYLASRFLSSHLAWTLNSSVAVTLHSLGDFQTLENGRIRNCQTRNYRHQTWKWMAYATVPVRSLQPPLNIAVSCSRILHVFKKELTTIKVRHSNNPTPAGSKKLDSTFFRWFPK